MSKLVVQSLGTQDYEICWQKMKDFTHSRVPETIDELWLVEHPSVYTLGVAGKMEHFISTHSIPIVKSDRGGQVTYHGPGQLVIYPLINIKRLKINVKELVCKLEKVVIQCLKEYDIEAKTQKGAPGVFVKKNKIASIGLRIRKECSYHGIALNVSMLLNPFFAINPCGYKGLKMCQINDFKPNISMASVKEKIIHAFSNEFRYTELTYQPII